MDTLVSIIVPIYSINYEYLKQCIYSLVNQSYKNTEIILIDDGSPDKCGEICDSFAEKYDNVVVIHKKNEGVSVARNVGIESAKGEYVIFVDADDWIEQDCVDTVLKKILEEKVDVLYFQRCKEDKKVKIFPAAESRALGKIDLVELQKAILKEDENHLDFDPKPPWGKIIRKKILCKEKGVYFPVGVKKSQDVIFNLYLLEEIDSAYYLDYLGYHYRINQESINHRYNPLMPQIMLKVIYECEAFINRYHKGDPDYVSRLGYRAAITQMRTIEQTYTFHKQSALKRGSIIEASKFFLNNMIVKKYIRCTSIRDYNTILTKVRFIMERYRLYDLYYLFCKIRKKASRTNNDY